MSQRYSAPAGSPVDDDDGAETLNVKSTTSSEKSWTLDWRFDANFGELEDSDVLSVDDLDIDLPGKWSMIIKSRPHDPEKKTIQYGLKWEGATVGAVSTQGAEIKFRFFARRFRGRRDDLAVDYGVAALSGTWPPTSSGEATLCASNLRRKATHISNPIDLDTHRAWRLQLTLLTNDADTIARPTKVKTALAFNSYTLSRQASDVRFVFPKRNLELWSTTSALESASPTLKTLFAGGMVDVKPKINGKRRKSEGPSATATPGVEDVEFDDSDDEGDDVYCGVSDDEGSITDEEEATGEEGAAEGKKKRTTKPNRELPEVEEGAVYQELKINTTAFTTYRAVLLWLASSHIDFAPLRSSSPSTPSSSTTSRKSHLRTFHTSNPSLPTPSSPKSVYRLAHHLKLPELESLALASFSSQLTTSNVAEELFSAEAMRFEALRKVVVGVAAKEWASVKGSEGMKDVQERMKEDDGLSLRFAKVMSELIMKI
ncbi:hypothetical protein BCR35DRAFT_304604 [Leucosporidium creatinivorum]|uniref:BTB domain-containing protein n=1 Tax=Leucosporidium creatinivorum TaxID=106004 RepID=A0A1Y2F7A9_9BASI|nr:hypothetical protein BCR35DRAFT_304604 [Leucosporidium creatinivorum]